MSFSSNSFIELNSHPFTSCSKSRETDEKPKSGIVKQFHSSVRVSNGLGFTDDDVFIDRPLVDRYSIDEDDLVQGMAVLNFNKKRSTWGWKAITIENA